MSNLLTYRSFLNLLLSFGMIAFSLQFNSVNGQGADSIQLQSTIERGIEFLKNRGQSEDGSFSPQIGIGATSLAVTALLHNGVPESSPTVQRGLKKIESSVRSDGGIYTERSRIKMYETCISILCLSAANRDGRYSAILDNAAKYIKGEQFDEADGKNASDLDYGGAGYGGNSRPDLSNTAFFVEALSSLKNSENDEAIQRALTFISRCQNLESPFNTSPEAAKINDGGFYYTVAAGGASPAGDSPEGGLRSYGSMTYAGLKSLLHARVKPDDLRVKAALEWIQKNYTVESNPGMGDAGLFYYYHLFAKALDASGIDTIRDARGGLHDWRKELAEHLQSLQSKDGSWVNKNERFMESDPNLSTTFSLLALSYCNRRP